MGTRGSCLADEEQRRGFHPRDVLERGVFPVEVDGGVGLPGRPAEPGSPVAADVALRVHRIQSAAPAPEDAALNRSVKVMSLSVMWPPALQPLVTMAPGRPGLWRRGRQRRPDVEVGVLVVVTDHVPQERVAVARAAPVIGLEHDEAARRESLGIVGERSEAELVGRCGPPCVSTASGYRRPAGNPPDRTAAPPSVVPSALCQVDPLFAGEGERSALNNRIRGHHAGAITGCGRGPDVARIVRAVER